MGVHAKLGPSGSGQWFACPGSIKAEREIARSESQNFYADEGTAAHELLEYCLRNTVDPHDAPMETILVNGTHYEVDLEMRNPVSVSYDWVRGYLLDNPDSELFIEQRVDPGVWMLRDDLFGTADVGIKNPREFVVADYKHGKGIPVEVEGNTQLLIYLLGFALPHYPVEQYRIVIMQPRAPHSAGPIRQHIVTRDELKAFYDKLEHHAMLTDSPDAIRVPGAKQCRFCSAQPTCKELAQHNLDVAMQEFKPFEDLNMAEPVKTARVDILTPEQVAYILDNASLLTKWIKAVSEYANAEAQKGRGYPGYKLVRKRSTRVFTPEEPALISILRGWGLKMSDIYSRKLNGPAPIEKKVKAMKDAKVMSAFKEIVEKPEGGLTLVAENDPRKEVEVTPIADDFPDDLPT